MRVYAVIMIISGNAIHSSFECALITHDMIDVVRMAIGSELFVHRCTSTSGHPIDMTGSYHCLVGQGALTILIIISFASLQHTTGVPEELECAEGEHDNNGTNRSIEIGGEQDIFGF